MRVPHGGHQGLASCPRQYTQICGACRMCAALHYSRGQLEQHAVGGLFSQIYCLCWQQQWECGCSASLLATCVAHTV